MALEHSKEFQEKLQRVVAEIKATARGRVCSTCKFFMRAFCLHPRLHDMNVEIYVDNAVACSFYARKRK